MLPVWPEVLITILNSLSNYLYLEKYVNLFECRLLAQAVLKLYQAQIYLYAHSPVCTFVCVFVAVYILCRFWFQLSDFAPQNI